ncbi:pyrroloquinoline quinone biosynthesis protein PqqE [Actinoplanes sp. NPDC048796]|uniref:pyrroloquinoline quinone biosynthesis protein PqqE n=1 Tax=Actinoplanes sp. NPDC048796 TaxID=3155640 RepID=UPI0033C4D4B5
MPSITRPGLAEGVRLVHDPVRDVDALLYPEGSLLLDGPAADVVRACDGRRDLAEIVKILAAEYDGVSAADVSDLVDRPLFIDAGAAACLQNIAGKRLDRTPLPVGMVAELTYRCPLSCGYCSNPVEAARDEMSAEGWLALMTQARDLGVLHMHFSGGEPVLRPELPELAAHARRLGMYTNLITSGVGLTARRLTGIDHVQLSVQHADATAADAIAGLRAHHRKIAAAALVREAGLPLTVNVVLHAGNVDALEEIAAFAASLGASRLELAHTQYYGWGLRNRAAIMPTAAQIHHADEAAARVHGRYDMEIVYVRPDHHTGRPKPCMNGWGSRQFAVNPSGTVLPCLAADQLPGPKPSGSLEQIWFDSELFNRFRGTAWMPDPCRSCDLRDLDFGGCRCQAYQLTGDAAATDPVCTLSPHHRDLVPSGGTRPAVIPRRYR